VAASRVTDAELDACALLHCILRTRVLPGDQEYIFCKLSFKHYCNEYILSRVKDTRDENNGF
jgi:hypothetical protein